MRKVTQRALLLACGLQILVILPLSSRAAMPASIFASPLRLIFVRSAPGMLPATRLAPAFVVAPSLRLVFQPPSGPAGLDVSASPLRLVFQSSSGYLRAARLAPASVVAPSLRLVFRAPSAAAGLEISAAPLRLVFIKQ